MDIANILLKMLDKHLIHFLSQPLIKTNQRHSSSGAANVRHSVLCPFVPIFAARPDLADLEVLLGQHILLTLEQNLYPKI